MIYYLFFFFFEVYDAHRDLHVRPHSFPTRRCSDLFRPTPAEQAAIWRCSLAPRKSHRSEGESRDQCRCPIQRRVRRRVRIRPYSLKGLTMTNMYQSSKGPVAIDTMALPYAKNALAKLQRDDSQRHRTAEIGWLDQHTRNREADAPTEEANRGIGGNNPPPDARAAMSWDAIQAHMDDLLTEARNWADGEAIDNQAKADEIGKLRQQLQDAAKLADDARVEEKRPLDEQIAAIQARYNVYIAPLKNKQPGSVSKAVAALGSLLTVWLNKLEAEKQEREQDRKSTRLNSSH